MDDLGPDAEAVADNLGIESNNLHRSVAFGMSSRMSEQDSIDIESDTQYNIATTEGDWEILHFDDDPEPRSKYRISVNTDPKPEKILRFADNLYDSSVFAAIVETVMDFEDKEIPNSDGYGNLGGPGRRTSHSHGLFTGARMMAAVTWAANIFRSLHFEYTQPILSLGFKGQINLNNSIDLDSTSSEDLLNITSYEVEGKPLLSFYPHEFAGIKACMDGVINNPDNCSQSAIDQRVAEYEQTSNAQSGEQWPSTTAVQAYASDVYSTGQYIGQMQADIIDPVSFLAAISKNSSMKAQEFMNKLNEPFSLST